MAASLFKRPHVIVYAVSYVSFYINLEEKKNKRKK
jgi:hypothetical protein